MQWLLNQLTQPQIISEGVIRQPTAVMLKAAQVIKELHGLYETDKNARLLTEQKYVDTHGKLVETESLLRIASSRIAELELNNRSLTEHNKQLEIERQLLREALDNTLAPPLETHQCIDLYEQILNEDNIRSLT